MVSKKDLVIVGLATFCIAVLFFGKFPSTTSQSEEPYDPWRDLDDNGRIGLTDLVLLAKVYGTTGDPTKNVNVTNWPDWMIPERHGNFTEKIVVFQTEPQWSLTAGVYVGGVVLTYNSEFVFEFNPLGTQFNITGVWLSITMFSPLSQTDTQFLIKINYQEELQATIFTTDQYILTVASLSISNPALINSIHQGINRIQIMALGYSGISGWQPARTYQITIYIEYEY